tara:strand:- start:3647 stop:4801 length:1155 start_codon:yes stop_codon:yes gene_type:complete
MSPTLAYLQDRHRVVTIGAAALDVFVLPSTREEFRQTKRFLKSKNSKSIENIINFAQKNGLETAMYPGGPAINVSQYFAAMKKEEGDYSRVKEVSAVMMLAAESDDGPLIPESEKFLENFESLGIKTRYRSRGGSLARALYVVNPLKHVEMQRIWEGNIEERGDYSLPHDFINQHDTLILAATHPKVAQRALERFEGDYVIFNVGPVLHNMTFDETLFKENASGSHIIMVNKAEAKIIMDNLGYSPHKGKLDYADFENIAKMFQDDRFRNTNIETIVVTMGSFGALILERTEGFLLDIQDRGIKTHPDLIRSTVGCGDAHLVGVVEAIWRAEKLPQVLIEGASLAQGALRHTGGTNKKFLKPPEGTYEFGIIRLAGDRNGTEGP